MKFVLLRADYGDRDKSVMVDQDEFDMEGGDASNYYVGGTNHRVVGELDITGDAEDQLPGVMEEA